MNEEILTNVDVVLYALFTLGGATKKIHTEKIAWESYQLSREKFSWSLNEFKKMGFPDKTTGRYALETAKKRLLGDQISLFPEIQPALTVKLQQSSSRVSQNRCF